ncbi:hypothetical protein DPMN_043855 [Dreissena polymorpha]|uniref:Uncharacterized protein n=1 Tax=Dreissena polymorpha TaxID=45954 RepID=A0A9D4HYD4_DREPO|nr:hypothetical protein DPMN_043855 [Dreissena polymorpha]
MFDFRNCSRVKEISDEVPTSGAANLQPLSVKLQNILDQLKSLQTEREDSIQLIKGSYDEQLQKLTETRRNINAALDKIETNTKNEMVATMTKLEYSLKSNVEKCTRLQNELNRHREAIQEICNKDTPKLSFITSKKSSVIIQKSESFLKENFKSSIKFQPNSEIIDYLSQLSGLGKIEESNQTLLLQEIGEQVCELNTQLSRQEGEVVSHFGATAYTILDTCHIKTSCSF